MFALHNPLSKGLQKATGSMQLKSHLRDQAKVYLLAGHRGITSNKSRVSSHQFDQADTIDCTDRLDVRAGNGFHCLGKRSFKTKTLVEVKDVIINRFGYSNDVNVEVATIDLTNEECAAFESPVSSD